MARRAHKSKATVPGNKMFSPGTVHTLELAGLFSTLKAGSFIPFAQTLETQEWNGNMDYLQAMQAAEFGKWDAPVIDHLTLPELETPSDDMRYFYDVTGDCLDVATFVSGEPEYWQVSEPIYKPAEARVIRLAVEIGGAGSVPAIEMQNRGEAIIGLIHSLELQGHSVEITIVRSFTNSVKESYSFLIPIKHAGQALDVKRLQFMIGHPAFFRRCLFALSEFAQGQNMTDCKTMTENYKPAGFIHIPHDAGRFARKSDSLRWAKEFAHTLTAETPNQN